MQRLAAKWIPLSIAARFEPALKQMANVFQMAADSHDNYTRRTTTSSLPVIFDYLQSVPHDLQKAESIDILVAGSDTTALTLTMALYHILSMPEVEKTLVESLDEVFSQSQNVPSLLQLEQIRYLVRTNSTAFVGTKSRPMLTRFQRACVNEALRFAMPVPGVLPRVVPRQQQPFVVDGSVVPPGVSHCVIVHLYLLSNKDRHWLEYRRTRCTTTPRFGAPTPNPSARPAGSDLMQSSLKRTSALSVKAPVHASASSM